MILAAFLILLALFVILPLVGFLVWTMVTLALSGIVLGGLARLIIPGEQPIGVIATILSGWIGAIVGALIAAAAFGTFHHHLIARTLIQVGVAAVAVLAWSAGARHGAVEHGKTHKIIDV